MKKGSDEKMKEKRIFGLWFPKSIDAEKLHDFANWLDSWGDFHKHVECLDSSTTIGKDNRPNHITEFGSGYEKAIGDVIDKLGLEFKLFDNRTKTGFSKE